MNLLIKLGREERKRLNLWRVLHVSAENLGQSDATDFGELLGCEGHRSLIGFIPESVAELEVSELSAHNALDSRSDQLVRLLVLGDHGREQVNILDESVQASVDLNSLDIDKLSHFLPGVDGRQAAELSYLGVRRQAVVATALNVNGNQVQVERLAHLVQGLEQVLGQVVTDVLVDLHERILEEAAHDRLQTALART